MSQHGFLAVPAKSTSEVDLVKPLTSYVDTTSEDKKPEITEAIQELNKLRTRAVCQPLDRHQSDLDILTRYYDQLVAIESKIIISATQNPVIFKWKDAFDKGGLFFSKASISVTDGSFERACVLFNCGSLMSQIASAQPLNTDDETKTAAKLFQQSAGVFAKLRDIVLSIVQDTTPDLSIDTLCALSALMVAQAQECIYIKASKDKMKSSALVKIAAQAGDFYSEAQKLMSKDTVKGLWDKEWPNVVSGKTFAFQALAQLHQAEVNSEERKYGEQLSRLGEAIKLGDTATKYIPSGSVVARLAPIKRAYESAKKDNDFIYHERVADFRTLPAVPRAALAKALPVTCPLSSKFKDMFSNLVPVQVLNAMQSYEGRKGELVNIESGRLREHTQLMNGILASLNLPAALDDVTSTETLPESIKQKSAKVKQAGGMAELLRMFNDLPELYKRNQEILDETHRMLSEEKESDEKLRIQFAGKWNRMSSDQLTGPLVQEVGKYRGILHTASNADNIVREKFEKTRRGIELLSQSENELRSSIPGQQPHVVGGTTEAVQKLRYLMEQVQSIKAEREKLEKDFKNVNCDIANDFLKALGDSDLLDEESISKGKIDEIYGPLKNSVNQSIKRQEDVMADIQTWNTRFTAEKSGSTTGAERENTLKLLAAGFDTFGELKSNLEEGTKFYNDLTPILVRLQQKVSDFVFARQTEKEDLMRQLQLNIVSGGATSAAAGAPPPRPPPPRPQEASTPTAPPRTQSTVQAGSSSVPNTLQPQPQLQQQPTMPTPQMPPYYQQAVPYGQPQPQQMPYYQPQFQPNYANPYMTFPGAFPNYQQQYGQFPMQPQYGQQFPQQPPQQQHQQQPPPQ